MLCPYRVVYLPENSCKLFCYQSLSICGKRLCDRYHSLKASSKTIANSDFYDGLRLRAILLLPIFGTILL
ncbi:MAG: hypothetical protein V7K50_03875 [Nostoc sp.]